MKLLLIVNAALIAGTLGGMELGADWRVLERAVDEAGKVALYTPRGAGTFVWSPVAAYPLTFIVPLGIEVWRMILVLAALAMPTWPTRIAVLVSWPFWIDLAAGNLLTVIFLAAVWALRGSAVGIIATFAFAILIPRPLMAPVVLWILWKRPAWRLPFLLMFVMHGALVWWTGLGPEWIHTLATTGSALQSIPINLSPTQFLGYWWLLAGLPLGAWFFATGRIGWAGLAISPYVWIYYLYWLLPPLNGVPPAGDRHIQAPVTTAVDQSQAVGVSPNG